MTLNLFYPATYLPHKNHQFLFNEKLIEFLEEKDIKIILTIDDQNYKFKSNSIKLIGRISYAKSLSMIKATSALLFLSSYESLGLPILEASCNKKSIIAPNLEYVKELIGETGYFLRYPLDITNMIGVLNAFKSDFIKEKNKIAKLKSNTISSDILIKKFLNELNSDL